MIAFSENSINNDKCKDNGNSCMIAIIAHSQQTILQGDNMSIGKQIRKRRMELNMSVDELAERIGKDRSTVYRYENGNIDNFPLVLLLPLADALQTTPQDLLSGMVVTSSKWLSERAEEWFSATGGYEFNEAEVRLFHDIAKYLMDNRNSEDYEENIAFLRTLFKKLNK